MKSRAFNDVSYILNWEQLLLCSLDKIKQSGLKHRYLDVRHCRETYRFSILKKVLQQILIAPSYQRFLHSSWLEIRDIIAAQWAENHGLSFTHGHIHQDLHPVAHKTSDRLKLKFGQQPCTILTAKKRVAFAHKGFRSNSPILLMGDDDLVSLHLARSGFSDITVFDIDIDIIRYIERVANDEALKIRCIRQDFSKPIYGINRRFYDLVYMDPYYSIDGLKLFLSATRQILMPGTEPTIFLSINLMSLFRQGLEQVETLINGFDFHPVAFHSAFNTYPTPKLTKVLIRKALRYVLNATYMGEEIDSLHFLTSDALILKGSLK